MQVPAATIVTEKPEIVHTPGVDDVNVTIKPESDVAVTVNGDAEYGRLFGCANVMACANLSIENDRVISPAAA